MVINIINLESTRRIEMYIKKSQSEFFSSNNIACSFYFDPNKEVWRTEHNQIVAFLTYYAMEYKDYLDFWAKGYYHKEYNIFDSEDLNFLETEYCFKKVEDLKELICLSQL